MVLGERFDEALATAAELHRRQTRKDSGVPYVSHLLAVAALVLEDGGSENEAIAGLLHDAVEDQGGLETLERIRRQFGDEVAELVLALSDTVESPKPPWRERKVEHLAHLEDAPYPVLRVAAADKLHNARALLGDYVRHGEAVWDRFNAPAPDQLWYYRSLADLFARRLGGLLSGELSRVVGDLEWLIGSRPAG